MDAFWDYCATQDDNEIDTEQWYGWEKYRNLYAMLQAFSGDDAEQYLECKGIFHEFDTLDPEGFELDDMASLLMAMSILILT